MADIACIRCHRPNPPDLVFCRFCGTRLPKELPPTPTPQPQPPVAPPLAELQAAHQQLQSDHADLAANHQQLQQQHQQVVSQLADVQQRQQVVEEQKQQAEGKIQGLLDQVTELKQHLEQHKASAEEVESTVAELQLKLKQAQQDLDIAAAKVQQFEASPAGQLTRPLWVKIASWGLLPLLGSAGGVAVGAYTGVNPYKPYKAKLDQLLSGQGKEQQQLQSTQSQLAATMQQLNQTQQQLASAQQSSSQVTSQLSSVQKDAQTSAAQLASARNELASAKAEIVKDRQLLGQKDTELQSAHSDNQQLTAKAAQAASLQDIINRHPYVNYKGPTQGVITVKYSARNDKPLHITIDHFRATGDSDITIDSLNGSPFPPVPLIVEPTSKNTTISSPPSAANGWQKVILTVQGKGSSQAMLRWSVF